MAYTLYADAFDRPLYKDPGQKTGHDNMMAGYEKSVGSSWPFFADPDWLLEPFFYKDGLPLAVLVTTADMAIVQVAVGHESSSLKEAILSVVDP